MSKIRMAQFPSGFANVDFIWILEYLKPKQTKNMQFVAGFIGSRYIKEQKIIKPEIGWSIIDKDMKP